jgi:hypothetical protein
MPAVPGCHSATARRTGAAPSGRNRVQRAHRREKGNRVRARLGVRHGARAISSPCETVPQIWASAPRGCGAFSCGNPVPEASGRRLRNPDRGILITQGDGAPLESTHSHPRADDGIERIREALSSTMLACGPVGESAASTPTISEKSSSRQGLWSSCHLAA